MIFNIITIAIPLTLLIWVLFQKDKSSAGVLTLITAIVIVFAFTFSSLAYYAKKDDIRDFISEKQSIESLPYNKLESSGIGAILVEKNKWLDRTKYDNQSHWLLWSMFIPDEVDQLERIKVKQSCSN